MPTMQTIGSLSCHALGGLTHAGGSSPAPPYPAGASGVSPGIGLSGTTTSFTLDILIKIS